MSVNAHGEQFCNGASQVFYESRDKPGNRYTNWQTNVAPTKEEVEASARECSPTRKESEGAG